jgi:hypothetical protein
MEPQDYMLDKNNDMYIVDGDWAVGDTNEIDIELILATSKGSWKESPTVGFGMPKYEGLDINAIDVDEIESGIKLQLQASGFSVNGVGLEVANQQIVTINIDADRQV